MYTWPEVAELSIRASHGETSLSAARLLRSHCIAVSPVVTSTCRTQRSWVRWVCTCTDSARAPAVVRQPPLMRMLRLMLFSLCPRSLHRQTSPTQQPYGGLTLCQDTSTRYSDRPRLGATCRCHAAAAVSPGASCHGHATVIPCPPVCLPACLFDRR